LISYEIRILRADGTTDAMRLFHISNDAAVQVARQFSGGKQFEVWRDSDCIFGQTPDPTPSPQMQVKSAANPIFGQERLVGPMELLEQLLMAVR